MSDQCNIKFKRNQVIKKNVWSIYLPIMTKDHWSLCKKTIIVNNEIFRYKDSYSGICYCFSQNKGFIVISAYIVANNVNIYKIKLLYCEFKKVKKYFTKYKE